MIHHLGPVCVFLNLFSQQRTLCGGSEGRVGQAHIIRHPRPLPLTALGSLPNRGGRF